MLGPRGVGGDERQVDLRLGHRTQLGLGLLGRLEQPLQRLRIGAHIDALVLLELVSQVVDDPPVGISAARPTQLYQEITDAERYVASTQLVVRTSQDPLLAVEDFSIERLIEFWDATVLSA